MSQLQCTYQFENTNFGIHSHFVIPIDNVLYILFGKDRNAKFIQDQYYCYDLSIFLEFSFLLIFFLFS